MLVMMAYSRVAVTPITDWHVRWGSLTQLHYLASTAVIEDRQVQHWSMLLANLLIETATVDVIYSTNPVALVSTMYDRCYIY
jgi:hypothetical protein